MIEENSSFSKLSLKEAFFKIKKASDDKETVSLWEKGCDSFSFKFKEFLTDELKDRIEVLVFKEFDEGKFKTDKTFASFSSNNVLYFAKVKISNFDEESLKLEFSDDIYKQEKREDIRFLTFPHHNLFLITNKKFESDVVRETNVISIAKFREEGIKENNEKKNSDPYEKLKNQIASTGKGYSKDISLLRLFDISKQGLSFFLNRQEKDFLDEFEKEKLFIVACKNILIPTDLRFFEIKNIKKIYNEDYLGSGYKPKEKLKVGILFDAQKSIESYIAENIIDEENN